MARSSQSKLKRARVSARTNAIERAHQLRSKGQLAGAQALYEQILLADPGEEEALLGLSLLFLQSARGAEALALLERGAIAFPDSAAVLANLGEAQRRSGLLSAAVTSFERALRLEPELAEIAFNMGVTLRQLGEHARGQDWLLRAVCLCPESSAMQQQLADVLWSAGEHGRALAHHQAALLGSPRSIELLLGLARRLHACELFDAASAMCGRALALDPQHADALLQQGSALLAAERLGPAVAALRRVCMLAPDHSGAHAKYAIAAFRTGLASDAVDSLRRAIALQPDATLHSNLVFGCAFDPRQSAADLVDEARRWAARYAQPLAPIARSYAVERDVERKLRIGYVSPDFWDHCQALFMAPLLAAHDRSRVEIVCYASVERPDRVTELLKQRADVWHEVAQLDDEALARRILDDRIDVLVDLTMHMAGNRLRTFAMRPAPVQISWLGYPGTTGLSQIEYRVSDRQLEPPQPGQEHVDGPRLEIASPSGERVLVLPDTFWCFDPQAGELSPGPLPLLQAGRVTFGCLNNPAKLNAGVLALWARVLLEVQGSRLLLRVPNGEPQMRVLTSLTRAGVDSDSIEFVEKQPRAAYLATFQRIDICLDTFPYNGHTVSLDALWMGVPVVTLVGSTIVGRAGLSQAHNLGLLELVAHDEADYVRIASALARDPQKLLQLRAELRTRLERSPLMDAPRFARNLEAAYRLAFEAWCASSSQEDVAPTLAT